MLFTRQWRAEASIAAATCRLAFAHLAIRHEFSADATGRNMYPETCIPSSGAPGYAVYGMSLKVLGLAGLKPVWVALYKVLGGLLKRM